MSAPKWIPLVACCLLACGPAARHGGDDDGTDANMGSGSGSGSGSGDDGCSEAAKLVYTVDQNNKLSQFNPQTKMFHDIGPLACTQLASPFSMGVDRSANAYVLYNNGQLFKVDTMTLACTPTAWHSVNGLQQFGMGFSTDMPGGTTDTLFIAGGSGPTQPTSSLATLDITSMAPTTRGTVTGWPELTGTGNAELWGFFPDASHPRVEQLNKQTGAAIKTFPESSLAGMPTAWAFAFYGGDFWVFLARDLDFATTVYQVDGMTGAIKSMTPTGNRTIVGAGVSTCAPVVIF